MKNTLTFFLLLIILISFGLQSCEKKAKTTTNFYTAQIFSDSIGNLADSINYNETSTKKSDEEILKEQEKREKELEKIIKKFKIDKKGNGFVYQIFCEEQKSNQLIFENFIT
jgi:hypothetical protein